MSDPADEADLIKQAQNGDKAAFEALLRLYYDVIYRIAFKWCGNQADAEDITQIACIKLARSLGSFQFKSAFLTWLYPLVINTAKDWAKSRARRTTDLDSVPEPSEPAEGDAKVYARQVMDQVRRLPDKEKEALYLVFSEGLSHREAATVMKCKTSTVSWYIHEARKKLQSFQNMECRYG